MSAIAESAAPLSLVRGSHEARWFVRGHVRSVAVDDFVVLLDRLSSRYLSLHGSGAAIWRGLETGGSVADIAAGIAEELGAPREQVETDTGALCRQLAEAGLITEKAPDPGARPGPDAETRQRIEQWIESWQAVPISERSGRTGGFARALVEIAAVEWAMRTGGMPKLRQRLARYPLTAPQVDPVRAWAIVEQAQRATALYVKKAWCLQRSTACAALLRAEGVPAEVVIGVTPVPFAAHAWVEIGHHVANDHVSRTSYFHEIDRF